MNKKEERQAIHDKYGGKCAYCGDPLVKGWHADHLLPVIRDWDFVLDENGERIMCEKTYQYKKKSRMRYPERDVFENKIPACASCNVNKHQMDIEGFRNLIIGFIRSLNLRSTQYKLAKRYGLVQETDAKVVFYFETLS